MIFKKGINVICEHYITITFWLIVALLFASKALPQNIVYELLTYLVTLAILWHILDCHKNEKKR